MCRNIKVLANFEPPATNDEVRASALQFVRKLSGTTKPSKANEEVFNQAVEEVTAIARRLARDQGAAARPRDRATEGEGALAEALRLRRDGAFDSGPVLRRVPRECLEIALAVLAVLSAHRGDSALDTRGVGIR